MAAAAAAIAIAANAAQTANFQCKSETYVRDELIVDGTEPQAFICDMGSGVEGNFYRYTDSTTANRAFSRLADVEVGRGARFTAPEPCDQREFTQPGGDGSSSATGRVVCVGANGSNPRLAWHVNGTLWVARLVNPESAGDGDVLLDRLIDTYQQATRFHPPS